MRAGALGASVALHLLFALAIFATASGTMPSGSSDPFGEGEAIEVSMSGWEGAASGSPGVQVPRTDTSASKLDLLTRRLRATQSDLVVTDAGPARAQGNLSALLQAIGNTRAPGRQGDGGAVSGDRREHGNDPSSAQSSRSGAPVPRDGAAGLWGQVEPCWRRLPRRSPVPVTLEVRLNAEGRLAGPPVIVRPATGNPGEQRLLAEAQAVAALQACLPYRRGLAGAYRLGFGGAP